MTSVQVLPQPRSLFKLLPNQLQTSDQDLEKPEQSNSPATVPLDDSLDSYDSPSAIPFPEEVTLVSDDGENHQAETTISVALMIELLKKRNERLSGVENEARQFQLQLQTTQELVDQLARDLNKSRGQVAVLIKQNTMLLNDLKKTTLTDNEAQETLKMMTTELYVLKGSMLVAAMYVLCGGKLELIAVMALVWLGVELAS